MTIRKYPNGNVRAIDVLNEFVKEEFNFGSFLKNIRETEYEDMTQVISVILKKCWQQSNCLLN